MFFGTPKKSSDPATLALQIGIAALLFLASLASLVGIVFAHVNIQTGTLTFGSSAGSLSILAFTVAVTMWSVSMKHLLAADAPTKKK